MEIVIVRHGPSMGRETFAKSGKEDRYRPLSQDGAKEMTMNARGIKSLAPDLQSVVTSPLTRAIQTANILNDEFGSVLERHETETLEPNADPDEFVSWAESKSIEYPLAVTGHKPNLNLLVSFLVSGQDDPSVVSLKKGSAMKLELNSLEAGSAQIGWYLVPEQLRDFGGD